MRHKVTDVIGDIGLLGARLIGQFSGLRNGHQINNELLQKLMVQEHTWQYISLREVNARWREFMVFANKLTTQNKYSETRIGRYLN